LNSGSGEDDFSGSDKAGFDADDEDNFSLLSMESHEVQMPIEHPEGKPGYDLLPPPVMPPAPPAFNVRDATKVKKSGPSQPLIAVAPVDKTAPPFDPPANLNTRGVHTLPGTFF